MTGFEDYGRRASRLERMLPTLDTNAPTIARLEPRKVILRLWSNQIVARGDAESEEILRHDGAHGVETEVSRARTTIAVAIKAGHRIGAAALKITTEDVGRHVKRISRQGGVEKKLLC